MSDEEIDALAHQLWAIYDEAWPSEYLTWEDMKPPEREAWIQVAEFVAQRDTTEIPDHR